MTGSIHQFRKILFGAVAAMLEAVMMRIVVSVRALDDGLLQIQSTVRV